MNIVLVANYGQEDLGRSYARLAWNLSVESQRKSKLPQRIVRQEIAERAGIPWQRHVPTRLVGGTWQSWRPHSPTHQLRLQQGDLIEPRAQIQIKLHSGKLTWDLKRALHRPLSSLKGPLQVPCEFSRVHKNRVWNHQSPWDPKHQGCLLSRKQTASSSIHYHIIHKGGL